MLLSLVYDRLAACLGFCLHSLVGLLELVAAVFDPAVEVDAAYVPLLRTGDALDWRPSRGVDGAPVGQPE